MYIFDASVLIHLFWGKEIIMKKFTQLGRLYKSRRNRSKANPLSNRRLGTLECLEDRRMLAAASFPGNFAPPDLVLTGVATQTVTAGNQLTVNLLTAGGEVTDKNAEGGNTGDTIRLYLDPDVGTDTPNGATMTTEGVFTWTPTAAQVGTHRIIVIAVDSGTPALADAETFTVTVVAATPPAVVDLNGAGEGFNATASFQEGATNPVAIAPDATIADTDDTNLESATITLSPRPDGVDEVLAVTTTDTAITANYSGGVLTLSGTDTVANYQKVLQTLTYKNNSPEPDTTARVVKVIVNDGTSNSAERTSTITIDPVDDAPTLDLNGPDSGTNFSATFKEDLGAVAIVGATSLALTDVDSANLTSATITISNLLDGSSELLEVVTTGTGITANYINGVLTLSGTDTLASYQQVLRTLKYSNSSQNPITTARLIKIIVKDATSDSPERTSTVSIERANDVPQIDPVPADQEATIGEEYVLTVTATDPDGDNLTYQLDVDDPEGNIPESATITKIDNSRAEIRWTPTAADTETEYTFSLLVTEDRGQQSESNRLRFTVTIVAAPPSVDANGDGSGVDFSPEIHFKEGDADALLIVDTDLSVADFDSANLQSATVTITNLQNGDDEALGVNTTDTAITANYAAGVLTLTGSDTLANYEKVLRTLRYKNVSEDPGTDDRIITIVAHDGDNHGAPATLTVKVDAVNTPASLVLPAPYDSATPVQVTQGDTVEFTATATDPDHTLAELTFHLDYPDDSDFIIIPGSATQPDISVDGDFVWVADVVGTFDITVLVTDAGGLPNSRMFTITVVAAEAPAAVTALEDLVDTDATDVFFAGLG